MTKSYDWIQGKPVVLRPVVQQKAVQLHPEEELLHFQQTGGRHHFQILCQFQWLHYAKGDPN